MAGQADLGQIAEADYSRILRTLSGSVTGRAFLLEYRRRTRPEETNALLAALVRIEDFDCERARLPPPGASRR